MRYKVEYDSSNILPDEVSNELETILAHMAELVEYRNSEAYMRLIMEHLEKYLIEWFTNHLKVEH